VGRTGRAGVNGKAVSFLEEGVDDCNLAKQLIDVMEKAGSKVPKELSDYANSGINPYLLS
jgi:superfamily II DNA/RNA helicase